MKELLKRIKPCNMGHPYIFISYSARDAEHVWADVHRFQQMGYNIWLDERNLDKTKDSWREDAMAAIRDMDCMLLVFYVSRNSLVSQACFSELSCTVEEYTRAVHFGPVKFIAVDVEPIGDIVEFSREVYTEIRRKDIPKQEKTTQAITLHKCIEEFFNSNNEKVRVRPRDMEGRKMDYYEEITAAFPDETRLFVPEPEEKEAEAVYEEEPLDLKETAPEVFPQEEDEAAAEETQQTPTEQPQHPWENLDLDWIHEQEGRSRPREDTAQRRETVLFAVGDAIAEQLMQGKTLTFQSSEGKKLSKTQIANACREIGGGVDPADVVALMDMTLTRNGKAGYLVTTEAFYWKETHPVTKRVLAEGSVQFDEIHKLFLDGRLFVEKWNHTTQYINIAPVNYQEVYTLLSHIGRNWR